MRNSKKIHWAKTGFLLLCGFAAGYIFSQNKLSGQHEAEIAKVHQSYKVEKEELSATKLALEVATVKVGILRGLYDDAVNGMSHKNLP